MVIYASLLFVAAAILFGCDDSQTSKRFTVTYDVYGTFSECTVFYITRSDQVGPDEVNQGGQSLDEDVTLPWLYTFDVTVTPMFPFWTQIAAVCSDSDGGDVEVFLSIDGEIMDTAQESGRNVNAMAEYQLIVN